MNADGFLRPFAAATRDALKRMLDLDAAVGGSAEPAAESDAAQGLTIVIPVVGDLSGAVCYRFPKDTAVRMVEILCGMSVDRVDDFVTSAMGEMANIISGNAMTGLSRENIVCDIRPPQILPGNPPAGGDGQPVRAVIRTDAGSVGLEVRLS